MSDKSPWKTIESGPYDYRQVLHPVVRKNYGTWKSHEIPKPGVLKHTAASGDVLYTVRAGTPRQDSVDLIRKICDIADRFADGYLRFTMRNNVELMTAKEENVEDVKELGLSV
jgi:sulfite reductase beta subunit